MKCSRPSFAPEDIVSRDRFGYPVPRQPLIVHTQAESRAYSSRALLLPPASRDGLYPLYRQPSSSSGQPRVHRQVNASTRYVTYRKQRQLSCQYYYSSGGCRRKARGVHYLVRGDNLKVQHSLLLELGHQIQPEYKEEQADAGRNG